MKMKTTLLALLLLVGPGAFAQKGNDGLQISAYLALPTGELADVAKTGYGGTAKYLLGFSEKRQQVSLESGYITLPVDDVPAGVTASYSTIPILTGHRFYFGGFNLESQAGISLNKVQAVVSGFTRSENKTAFTYALGLGYTVSNGEIGVKYQVAEIASNDNISFVGIRLSYMFGGNK